ncbi:MAG TPA: LD-carboxypeptidase [Flavisolibacter sp.]|jgi:muramoyltetrapeptide carboxypeptidase|nr:LD-carboxypeptidase [Flavisolibacter sp.]
MTIPPYLTKGDTIGVVAPAGFMDFERMHTCIETLDGWGYTVQMGSTTHSNSANYFSGTDQERLDDLQQMLDNKNIKAILCARGGYGTSRIIDNLSFKKFKKNPKWIVGFSDVTVLHAHLHTVYKIASLHAPMAGAFNDGEADNPYVQSLKKALEGDLAVYETAGHEQNRNGVAEGELVGGNLALLAHLVGTPSDFRTKNKILFLEDTGEYLYNIDRMLLQLKRSGKLDKLAGLIVGGFTSSKDTERPFGKSLHEILYDHIKEFDYPVCFGFPVSHEKENVALKVGVEHTLVVSSESATLKEKDE